MSASLIDTAPDFDQPIAVLKHCHDKIRKQLATLQTLRDHLAQHGVTIEAAQTAKAVLKYFNQAAHLHHADEEQDLMPMLQATARGDDAALLHTLVPDILADHRRMDQAWGALRLQLEDIANETATALSNEDVDSFCAAYTAHMSKEEGQLAPMAKRLFSAAQMARLGAAMQKRRGIIAGDRTPAGAASGTAAGAAAGASNSAGTGTEVIVAANPAAGFASAAAMPGSLAGLRKDYSQASLNETDLLDDPITQFGKWFEEALRAEVNEPNAMSVATVGPDGKPSSRIVLIKQYDARGFTWYTNYNSQKGAQLAANPHAALLFFWSELERQVRIEGSVIKTAEEESNHYFHSRPLLSRLAAIASQQSAPIGGRDEMESKFDAVASQAGQQPPRPAHWGGYRLVPERIEFWQGRRSRFHDRIVFTLQADGTWVRERLQP